MTQQLILPFAPRLNFKAEDFFVSPCNQEAFLLVQNDTKWPIKMLCLYGEKGSGKTHLAHLFSDNIIKAKDLTLADIPLFKFRTVLEDIDETKDETILFHAFNYAKENGLCLLMTARQQPLFKLPDLKSRIASVVSVKIHAPDDDLIRSILCKLFSDRQIAVEADVIGYLLTHMERTYETLRLVVEKVDKLSFEKKKKITIPLLKEALSEIQNERLL
ncbi:MAG: hypothetical protein J6U64_03675 [Alphaproteobacteria bacterium]|nr:hypothetical protein [Alphaproteobacteria bacterium]